MITKDVAVEAIRRAGLQRTIRTDDGVAFLQEFLGLVIEELKAEGRSRINGFGFFKVRKRRERWSRNPRTGERTRTPERTVVQFKPSQSLLDSVSGE